MFSFLILILFMHQCKSIPTEIHKIGVIHNVSMITSNGKSSIMNGSCNKCLCAMLMNATLISGFNCYKTNETCEFFSNALESGSFWLMNSSISTFYVYPSFILNIMSTMEVTTDSINSFPSENSNFLKKKLNNKSTRYSSD